MRGGKQVDEVLIAKILAFGDELNAAAEARKKMDAAYPNIEFKAREYCQLSKMDVLEKHSDTGKFPYYAQKLHVSLELKDGDHQKVWDKVLLEIFKNPCVFGVKILSPYATASGREAQPGKEVTVYFLRPEDMNPPMSLPSIKAEHLRVIKQLDNLLLQLDIKPSVPPSNQDEPEYSAAQVCNDAENSNKGLDVKSLSIYISPPDQNERGEYVPSHERKNKMHTYTKDVVDHCCRIEHIYAKLDLLISMMPVLVEISNQKGNIEFQNLLDTILQTIHNENTSACIDSIKVFAQYCSEINSEPEKAAGLFAGKRTGAMDTRIQDVSRVIMYGLPNMHFGLRDFKEKLLVAAKVNVLPVSKSSPG